MNTSTACLRVLKNMSMVATAVVFGFATNLFFTGPAHAYSQSFNTWSGTCANFCTSNGYESSQIYGDYGSFLSGCSSCTVELGEGASLGPWDSNYADCATVGSNLVSQCATQCICTVSVASLPDLTAGWTIPTAATAGVPVTLSVPVRNIGTASTGAGFLNFFQVATGAGGGGTLTDLPPLPISALAAGGNTFASYAHTFSSSGTYSVRMCVDKNNRNGSGTITESNENNNCGPWGNIVVIPASVTGSCSSTHYNCTTGTSGSNADGATSWTWMCNGSGGGTNASCSEIKPLPDITADSASPTAATAGTPVSLSAPVRNTGAFSTGASFPAFFQVATTSGGGGSITDLPSLTLSTLAIGNSTTATYSSYPFLSAGTYSVRVCTDKVDRNDAGMVAESDENNNCGAWADVVVSATPAPVDGEWSEWSLWGECSASCGGGTQSKSRTCTNPAPANGGAECTGNSMESQSCNTQACVPVTVCSNSICESGETLLSCPQDCKVKYRQF